MHSVTIPIPSCRTRPSPPLRPSTTALLRDLLLATPARAGWSDYEQAKRRLSAHVGPDAPAGRRDDAEFHAALLALLRGLRL